MGSGISFKRLIIVIGAAFVVGVLSPSIVCGSELLLQSVLSAFQEFSTQLKGLIDGVNKVKENVKEVENKLVDNVNYGRKFIESGGGLVPEFINTSQKIVGQFDDSRKSEDYIQNFRKKIGLGGSAAENVIELENDVRKAYVVLQDATHAELQKGETPKQKVSREDLTRVHQQRGLILRNAAIKGIALSLEQQKEMYSERSSAIFDEVKDFMEKSESAKDFAHVQTMVMLAIWTELRQQRQLIAALLQSQAAINLHNDPLLVDISPASKKRNAPQGSTGISTDRLTSEEQSFLANIKKMNEEYRQKNPTQSSAR